MDTSVVIRSIVVLLLVLLSAFFSSAETAMTTVSRIRVQSLAEQGDKRAALLERIIADSGKMLSTILIGNNIVNMAVSALVTTLTMLENIIDLHAVLALDGIIASNFHSGHVLIDFGTNEAVVCGIDLYRRKPAYNDKGEMRGMPVQHDF